MKTHIKLPFTLHSLILAILAILSLASCKQLADLANVGEDHTADSSFVRAEAEEDEGEDPEVSAPTPSNNIGFGIEGTVSTDIGGYVDRAYSVAIQTDGKIVAGGQWKASINEDHGLVRYEENGDLDSEFGNQGIATTFFNKQNGSGHTDYLHSVKIQSDGKILTGGVAYTYSSSFVGTFALSRWNADGTLDTDFGKSASGKLTTSFGSNKASALELVIRDNGKILAIGNDIGKGERVALAQYKNNGATDKSFGSSGTTLIDLSIHPTSGALQDEKILVVGSSHEVVVDSIVTEGKKFAVVRFNENGIVDAGFGSSGKVLHAIGNDAEPSHVMLQSDGKMILVGSAVFTDRDFVVARLNADGSLDNSFGAGAGWVRTDFGNEDAANAVAIQSDGKIVVAGYSAQDNGMGGFINKFAVARYNADGSLDSSFNSNGKVSTLLGSSSIAYSVALQSDGKIVVAGEAKNDRLDFAVARYRTNGALDVP